MALSTYLLMPMPGSQNLDSCNVVFYPIRDRRLDGAVINLVAADGGATLDETSQTVFGLDDTGTGGAHDGRQLTAVPAGVEFAHSFLRFCNGRYCGDSD